MNLTGLEHLSTGVKYTRVLNQFKIIFLETLVICKKSQNTGGDPCGI